MSAPRMFRLVVRALRDPLVVPRTKCLSVYNRDELHDGAAICSQ